MSSTAAQRSVADFKAAGLNPALAYNQTASSPSGSTAQMGDVVGAGISGAMSGRRMTQELQNARVDNELKASQALATRQQGQLAIENQKLIAAQTAAAMRENLFQTTVQPFMLRQEGAKALAAELQNAYNRLNNPLSLRANSAGATLKELEIPVARGLSKYADKLGMLRPVLGDLFNGARALTPILR